MKVRCFFCNKEIGLRSECAHLYECEKKTTVYLGTDVEVVPIFARVIDFYKTHAYTNTRTKTMRTQLRVKCVCNERFSANHLRVRIAEQPLFPGYTDDPILPETNSFQAHLIQVGGLAEHIRRLRLKVLMDRIAGES